MIQIKQVYEAPTSQDGARFLVERIWPRGMKKEALKIDGWLKDIAPSAALRRWFNQDPAKWAEFQKHYRLELARPTAESHQLLEATKHGDVTLLYSAHDTAHNNAVVLQPYLETRRHRK